MKSEYLFMRTVRAHLAELHPQGPRLMMVLDNTIPFDKVIDAIEKAAKEQGLRVSVFINPYVDDEGKTTDKMFVRVITYTSNDDIEWEVFAS